MAKKEFNRDTSILMELIRFVIIGLYGTLIDFAIEGWITSMTSNQTASMGHVPAFFVLFAILPSATLSVCVSAVSSLPSRLPAI